MIEDFHIQIPKKNVHTLALNGKKVFYSGATTVQCAICLNVLSTFYSEFKEGKVREIYFDPRCSCEGWRTLEDVKEKMKNA